MSKIRHPISYVSAPVGTGKSFATGEYIRDHIAECNFAYVAQSLNTLKEKYAEMTSAKIGIDPGLITVITSETNPNHAKSAIIAYLKKARSQGHVLLMTQQAYFDLAWFPRRDHWLVLIDEIPQVDWAPSPAYQLPKNYKLLAKHLQVGQEINETLLEIRPRDRAQLRRLLDGPRDDIVEHFKELFRRLASGNWQVFADRATVDRLRGRGFSKTDETKNLLHFLAMLTPKPFENAV
jgi:hypothetical protein